MPELVAMSGWELVASVATGSLVGFGIGLSHYLHTLFCVKCMDEK